jgi:competence protein ComER
MEVGIIGTGNMGTILVEAFVYANAVSPSSITVTNRTKAKALKLQDTFPEIKIESDAIKVAKQSKLIFICVKPLEIYQLLQQIKPVLTKDTCIVSITSPITVENLEKELSCSVARIIPSITNRALAGVSLFTYGANCSDDWKAQLWTLFKQFSVPVEIEENITRVSSDIVSCGPAFLSYLTQRFILAAEKETEIDLNKATVLASEMLIGLGELLKKGIYTLPTLQEKVCVKGGITGEGIKIFEAELGEIFEHVFQATHRKYAEDIELIEKQFSK